MRVAFVAESFLPQVNGVTNSVLRVLDHLADAGHEAMVLAPGTLHTPREYRGFHVTPLMSLALPGYTQVRLATTPSFSIERILEDFAPDVVHLAAPFALGYRGALATARLSIPSVALYQTEVPTYARRYGIPAAEPMFWWRVREIHSLATMTLAPSTFAREQLTSRGIPRIKIWGRGVDAVRFHPSKRSEAWRAQHAPGGEKIIGYVGRLANEKQVGDLAVLANLPDTKLVIVGGGPVRDHLERHMPNAVFLGQQGGDELATSYASMDVFVTPGEMETFGQTIQEAMASGVPVIAPRRGGPIDLIQPSHNGWLYEPGDLAAMRSHVEDLLGDDAKRQAFSVTARRSVENKTWFNICEQLMDYYEQAITFGRTRVA